MLRLVRLFAAITAFAFCLSAAQDSEHSPKLLLTPKLLRRLQRDRERQTARWLNFYNRIETAPTSPERGFELALYYAVTHDPDRGKESIRWALAHKCEQRQVALVMDWAADLLSAPDKAALNAADCDSGSNVSLLREARNQAFLRVANNQDIHPLIAQSWPLFRKNLQNPALLGPDALYALCEFLQVVRTETHNDLRQDETEFFTRLPKAFLLSLRPEQVEHPGWMAHAAALALVGLDPNLENSQFLQGWAMEGSQMLRNGPGVAYEYLWADPYLPGIAYQNMDPWVYNPAGELLARTGWEANACWLSIRPDHSSQENCSAAPPREPLEFGTMRLVPFTPPCADIPNLNRNQELILSRLGANASLVFEHGNSQTATKADPAGLWRAPNPGTGRVCVPSRKKH